MLHSSAFHWRRGSQKKKTTTTEASKVSHFIALPSIRKPVNGSLPKTSLWQVRHTPPTKKQRSSPEQQTALTTTVSVFRQDFSLTRPACCVVKWFPLFKHSLLQICVYNAACCIDSMKRFILDNRAKKTA